jgi:hypothetical protein
VTRDEIYRWQGLMFIYSCWLYDNELETVFSDPEFDSFCADLHGMYDDLPFDMQDRIDIGNLRAGTSLGMTYLEEDAVGAIAWFEQVRGRSPEKET